ncbi:ROK family protein [Evansella sp. AB-rgal1]|uniref:ROK family protein n=1 Tax=Evansella sp. AB-rgal1 TaxID=3242696 RepID=UPI00359DE0C5
MKETGKLLGFGLTNVINLLNPEIVIIGGGMSAAGDRLLNPVRNIVKRHTLKLSEQACIIRKAKLGSKAGMIGAASYAFEKLHPNKSSVT